jgi:hypothetical protein
MRSGVTDKDSLHIGQHVFKMSAENRIVVDDATYLAFLSFALNGLSPDMAFIWVWVDQT